MSPPVDGHHRKSDKDRRVRAVSPAAPGPASRCLGHICGRSGAKWQVRPGKAGIPGISDPRLIQGLFASVAVAGNPLPGLALKVLGATNRVSI
jgi:hypothetical protein